ncbi:---NA--- [Octopus vulgaris]|uniref:---NA n=1 Tax=Octopus vulgaris TaxID=6645 RepID=A0AA36BZA2_OCTVU|nr:---NA--- [Octopus vulgaris]
MKKRECALTCDFSCCSSQPMICIEIKVRSQISVSICGKSFSVRSHLTKCNLIHRKAKSYHCDISGKLFSRSSGPSKHTCTLKGKMPYHFDICGNSF